MSTELQITSAIHGNRDGSIEVASTRQSQEVQAMVILAKRYPRDVDAATRRILDACKRPGFAEVACYEYEKGKTKVTGPSIRCAEMIAQCWGNIDFGITELEQTDGESTIQAHCWDLETNSRQTKVFHVAHVRYSREGGRKDLNDPRDIYEVGANNGARRLRSCILGIIPGDIIDQAMTQCEKTLANKSNIPIAERIEKMLKMYEGIQVTGEMIQNHLKHKTSEISERELIRLGKAFNSIQDGFTKKEDFFGIVVGKDMPLRKVDEIKPDPVTPTEPEEKLPMGDMHKPLTAEPQSLPLQPPTPSGSRRPEDDPPPPGFSKERVRK